MVLWACTGMVHWSRFVDRIRHRDYCSIVMCLSCQYTCSGYGLEYCPMNENIHASTTGFILTQATMMCLATRHLSRLKALCRKPHSAPLKPTRTCRGACQARSERIRIDGTRVCLRPTDADVWAKRKAAEAGTSRAGTQAAAGLVNKDADRVMRRPMERVRSVEAEMALLRGNEKSIEEMECRNEGRSGCFNWTVTLLVILPYPLKRCPEF